MRIFPETDRHLRSGSILPWSMVVLMLIGTVAWVGLSASRKGDHMNEVHKMGELQETFIPPMDQKLPAHMETATFSMG